MLTKRAYIGEYYSKLKVIPGGMPQLVDDETFEVVHRRMTVNKRRGARTKAQLSALADDAPDYWLTGRMYCRNCGASMQGVSDTSKTGKNTTTTALTKEKRSVQQGRFAKHRLRKK